MALFKYFLKCKTFSKHPALPCFRIDSEDINPGAFRHSPPVGVQLWRLSDRYGIDISCFEIAKRPPPTPFWVFPPLNITFLFVESKANLLTCEIKSRFNEFKANHSSYEFYYTDEGQNQKKR